MLFIILLVGTFFLMEGVAWATHKYIMHGFLWHLHEDHHTKNSNSFFEKNDYFFVIFAVPGMACILLGTIFSVPYTLPIGLGITIYGFAYFLVHEIFIHQRFKVLRNTNLKYFKAIRRAHKVHHKHLGKEDGECFGMLWVPLKYFSQNK
ncbi:MAG: carotene hydroxylase [Flavobacteriales bacterium]|jgi:beta-carotene 3-hydroxylase|nr:carotene hydroxylase [Flavobacteriales bacterium]|tara:strand:+ start:5991 stop:6437 length:447 start_codon:yes stop_codon:yes gene_type:complete